MDVMRGRKRKIECETLKENVQCGNDLNKFFARFGCHDFENERE